MSQGCSSLAKVTPLDPQHRMYYITGTQRKGLVHMPYSTCSSGMFVVANVIMNIIKKLCDSIDKLLTALGAHDSWLWERLLLA